MGGRNLDARTSFFYQATVNTPAMVAKMPGVGSQYAYTETRCRRKLSRRREELPACTFPPMCLRKDFWSVVLYDPQTRSELQTTQPFPARTTSATS